MSPFMGPAGGSGGMRDHATFQGSVGYKVEQGQADRWHCVVWLDAVCLCPAVRFVDTPDFSGPASGFGGKKDDAIVEGVVSYKLKQGQAPPVDLSYYAETGKMGGHMVALL